MDGIILKTLLRVQPSSRFIIPFEIKIPDTVNKSYVGKYSEYFWGFDAKLDVSFSKDMHARAIIEIV